jgi:protein-S-isoprenylcysteine O-methyltransferase Ste14
MQTLLRFLPETVEQEPVYYGLLTAFLTFGALLGIWFALAFVGLAAAAFRAVGG